MPRPERWPFRAVPFSDPADPGVRETPMQARFGSPINEESAGRPEARHRRRLGVGRAHSVQVEGFRLPGRGRSPAEFMQSEPDSQLPGTASVPIPGGARRPRRPVGDRRIALRGADGSGQLSARANDHDRPRYPFGEVRHGPLVDDASAAAYGHDYKSCSLCDVEHHVPYRESLGTREHQARAGIIDAEDV